MSKKVLPYFDQEDTQDYFCLTWNITRKCSFCCPYCSFFDNNTGSLSDEDFHKVGQWIENNFVKDKRHTQLTIFGGEPTLNPKQCEFAIGYAAKVANLVNLYTNFQMDKDTYYEWMEKYSQLSLLLTFHEHKYPADKFIEDVKMFKNFVHRVNVTVTDKDPSSAHVKEVLKGEGFNVIDLKIIPCRHQGEHKNSIEGTKNIVDTESWNKFVNDPGSGFLGWTCLAGKNNLYVEWNGDVYPCQGVSPSHNTQGYSMPKLMNILESPNRKPILKETTCIRKKCRFELYLSKYKND